MLTARQSGRARMRSSLPRVGGCATHSGHGLPRQAAAQGPGPDRTHRTGPDPCPGCASSARGAAGLPRPRRSTRRASRSSATRPGRSSAATGSARTPTACPPATTHSRSTRPARGWPTATSRCRQDYPPYAMHHQVAAYFTDYVEHFGFGHTITFDTHRRPVTPASGDPSAPGRWDVAVTGPHGSRTETFDAVVVANGHHWDARWPEPAYPGSVRRRSSCTPTTTASSSSCAAVTSSSSARATRPSTSRAPPRRSPGPPTLSQRRGQWVLRKFLLGRPSDQIALPSWLPWWVTSSRLRLGAAPSGNVAKLGLPQPTHHPGQSHPVQSEGIRDALRSGRLTPRPASRGSMATVSTSSTGPAPRRTSSCGPPGTASPSRSCDRPRSTSSTTTSRCGTGRSTPTAPACSSSGSLQPVGAVMPLAEAQGVWIAEMMTRRYVAAARRRGPGAVAREDRHTRSGSTPRTGTRWRSTSTVISQRDLARERRRGAKRARDLAAATGHRS